MLPQVLLADDHTLMLDALERLLSTECTIVGKVSDGRTLVAAARTLAPDLIVLDVNMSLLNGLDAGRQIKQAHPDVKLIYLTTDQSADVAAEAFRAGGSAFLLKRSSASELLTAIREVLKNHSYVTPLLSQELVGSFLHHASEDARLYDLTPRQREVLQLLAEGQSLKGAAAILNVAPRTVAFHKYKMMAQLKIKTTAELIKFAITHHLV